MNQPNSTATDPEKPQSFFGVIVHSFFIIPFLIAVFCVLLFSAMMMLTREQATVYDFLDDVKTGGMTKRWQAAFELSRVLANPKIVPHDKRFHDEMTSAFEKAVHDDNRVRQYLALAMGRSQDPVYFETLSQGLNNEKEENIPSILYALGMLGDTRATQVLAPYLDHPRDRVRSIAAAALGNLQDPESKEFLKKSLTDPQPNVQWTTAIALAQLGDGSGKPVLVKLLDRQYLASFPEIDPVEQSHLLLAAIHSAVKLRDPVITARVQQLSTTDKNMKVRSAAMEYLQNTAQ